MNPIGISSKGSPDFFVRPAKSSQKSQPPEKDSDDRQHLYDNVWNGAATPLRRDLLPSCGELDRGARPAVDRIDLVHDALPVPRNAHFQVKGLVATNDERQKMITKLNTSPVDVRVQFGSCDITMEDFLQLTEGDIIKLDNKVTDDLIVQVKWGPFALIVGITILLMCVVTIFAVMKELIMVLL